MNPIQFYFEFASPYSYIASLEIDELGRAAGREVEWLPIDISVVWAAHGVLDAYAAIRALKRRYIMRDAVRCARVRGVTLAAPSASARDASIAKLAYWGLRDQDSWLKRENAADAPAAFDDQGRPKAAARALAQGLARAVHANSKAGV